MNPGLFFFGVTVLLGYSALILVKSDDAASLHLGNPRLQPWASIDMPQHWALAPGACLLVSLHTSRNPQFDSSPYFAPGTRFNNISICPAWCDSCSQTW